MFLLLGSVHVYRYSTRADNPETEKTVNTKNLNNDGEYLQTNNGKLIYGKEDVSVNGRYTVNKEITVKTQTFELETVLSPTKTTPYSCFGHTHHVTGEYVRHVRHVRHVRYVRAITVLTVLTLVTVITVINVITVL